MRAFVLVLAVLLLPMASAQINQADPFSITVEYSDMEAGELLVGTGETSIDLDDAEGTFVFFDPEDLVVSGLNRVCWAEDINNIGCSSGSPQIRVDDGTAIAMKLPDPSDSKFTSDFSLALFADFKGSEDAQSLPIEKTIVAPSIGGALEFTSIKAIPPRDPHIDLGTGRPHDDVGQMVTLGSGSVRITGSNPITLNGQGIIITFDGPAAIDLFGANSPLVPFEGKSSASMKRADADAAREGLDFKKITEMFSNLDAANKEEGNTAADTDAGSGLGGAQDVLSEVLNGALVRFPTAGQSEEDAIPVEEIVIFLFDDATVTPSGTRLTASGHAAFQLMDGGVANSGDTKLYGFTISIPMGESDVPLPVKLPWWGWAIWIVAIGLFVANLIVKAPKKHATFDRKKWIGWIAAVAAMILVFFLWDLEVRSVWGTSALTTSASGTALWVTYGVQFLTLTTILGLLKAPIGWAIKGILRLSRVGTFMGLGGPVATIAAYLLGALLLLPFLDLILSGVLASLGDS